MVAAYVLVSVEAGKGHEVLAALRGTRGVTQAHECWGQPDIFTFVEVSDESALADTVLSTIQGISGVRSTETHIVVPE